MFFNKNFKKNLNKYYDNNIYILYIQFIIKVLIQQYKHDLTNLLSLVLVKDVLYKPY